MFEKFFSWRKNIENRLLWLRTDIDVCSHRLDIYYRNCDENLTELWRRLHKLEAENEKLQQFVKGKDKNVVLLIRNSSQH